MCPCHGEVSPVTLAEQVGAERGPPPFSLPATSLQSGASLLGGQCRPPPGAEALGLSRLAGVDSWQRYSPSPALRARPRPPLVAKTRSGADCGSDNELLIAKFRLKLKKVGKTTRPFRYDLNQPPLLLVQLPQDAGGQRRVLGEGRSLGVLARAGAGCGSVGDVPGAWLASAP